MPSNHETVASAFADWSAGKGNVTRIFAEDMFLRMRDGKVIDATAFFDSIAFDELWRTVPG